MTGSLVKESTQTVCLEDRALVKVRRFEFSCFWNWFCFSLYQKNIFCRPRREEEVQIILVKTAMALGLLSDGCGSRWLVTQWEIHYFGITAQLPETFYFHLHTFWENSAFRCLDFGSEWNCHILIIFKATLLTSISAVTLAFTLGLALILLAWEWEFHMFSFHL